MHAFPTCLPDAIVRPMRVPPSAHQPTSSSPAPSRVPRGFARRPSSVVGALVAVTLSALPGLARAETGKTDPPGPTDTPSPGALDVEPATPDAHSLRQGFPLSAFGPRYFVEGIQIVNHVRTEPGLVLGLLDIEPGDQLQANDPRVDVARLRLIASGLFLDARLSLRRGTREGGVILQVELEERGSFILDDIYLGTSRATAFWAGGSVTETNLGGHGLSVGAAFVASTTPEVPGSEAGLAGQARIGFPAFLTGGYAVSASLTFAKGSDYYRVAGPDGDATPALFSARNSQRLDGRVGAAHDVVGALRLYGGLRVEGISAQAPATANRVWPSGETTTIDFHLAPDFSRLTALVLSLSHDTRSDPVMPRSGHTLVLGNETATGLLGSYTYSKTTLLASQFFGLPRGHAFGLHLFVGSIFGSAPEFDRFFIGDLDELLAPRALGLNFSTQGPPTFGTGIGAHRYDDHAARLSAEYVLPLWRRHGWIYGGYGFCSLGVFGMTSSHEPAPLPGGGWSTWPLGFTGDLGVRLDTAIGLFRLSIGNLLGRVSY